MKPKTNVLFKPYSLSLGFLSKCQCELIKGLVVDMNNCFNEVFSSFNPLNPEFAPGCRIIDTYLVSFHFILLANAMKTTLNPNFNNLIIWLLGLQATPSMLLLSWILMLRTILLLLFLMCTFTRNSSPKLFITL